MSEADSNATSSSSPPPRTPGRSDSLSPSEGNFFDENANVCFAETKVGDSSTEKEGDGTAKDQVTVEENLGGEKNLKVASSDSDAVITSEDNKGDQGENKDAKEENSDEPMKKQGPEPDLFNIEAPSSELAKTSSEEKDGQEGEEEAHPDSDAVLDSNKGDIKEDDRNLDDAALNPNEGKIKVSRALNDDGLEEGEILFTDKAKQVKKQKVEKARAFCEEVNQRRKTLEVIVISSDDEDKKEGDEEEKGNEEGDEEGDEEKDEEEENDETEVEGDEEEDEA